MEYKCTVLVDNVLRSPTQHQSSPSCESACAPACASMRLVLRFLLSLPPSNQTSCNNGTDSRALAQSSLSRSLPPLSLSYLASAATRHNSRAFFLLCFSTSCFLSFRAGVLCRACVVRLIARSESIFLWCASVCD